MGAITAELLQRRLRTHTQQLGRNSGGGHLNHSFFWCAQSPLLTACQLTNLTMLHPCRNVLGKSSDNNGPSSEVKSAIDSAFGSLDELKSKFNAAAAGQFGSGWAWLSLADGKLAVSGTANQDNPLVRPACGLLLLLLARAGG